MDMKPKIASAASLIADPARAAILESLLDGSARPAGELAYAAGVTAQTASAHLAKLVAGGLLMVESEGRHRYYRLAGSEVAAALETLASIDSVKVVRQKPLSCEARSLRFARCCYDHLAGSIGVALTRKLQERGFLVAGDNKQFLITPAGATWFRKLGLDVEKLRATPRGLARQCLDWTERQHHLAGPLGVELMAILCSNGWLRRSKSSRAVEVTPVGQFAFAEQLGIDAGSLASLP